MKRNYLILGILIVFSNILFENRIFAQDEELLVCSKVEASPKIQELNSLKQTIKTNLTNFKKIEKNDENNEFKVIYLNENELQLIMVESNKNSTINEKVEWYFSNNQLFYCEQTLTNITTNKIIDLQKFFLNNEKLSAWLKSDFRSINENSKEFKDLENDLLNKAKLLKLESKSYK